MGELLYSVRMKGFFLSMAASTKFMKENNIIFYYKEYNLLILRLSIKIKLFE